MEGILNFIYFSPLSTSEFSFATSHKMVISFIYFNRTNSRIYFSHKHSTISLQYFDYIKILP